MKILIIALLFTLQNTELFGQDKLDKFLILHLPINSPNPTKDCSKPPNKVKISKDLVFDYDSTKNAFGSFTFNRNKKTFIEVKSNFGLSYSTISLCTWIKTSEKDSLGRIIVLPTSAKSKGLQVYSLNMNMSPKTSGRATIYFDKNDGSGPDSLSTTKSIADNNWHFIVGIIDSKNKVLKIYVDGKFNRSKSFSVLPIPSKMQNLQIGRYDEKYKEYFDGSLDEISIYKKALTKEDVTFLFKQHKQ